MDAGRQRGASLAPVQADRETNRLFTPGRHQVKLQHEVGAGLDPPRHAVAERPRLAPGRPTQEVTSGGDRAHHAFVAGLGIGEIELARGAAGIGQHRGVVHGAGRAWTKLDRRHEAPGRVERHHEVANDVVATGLQAIRLRQLDHQIGHAEPPPRGQLGLGRQVARVSLRCSRDHPARDGRDLAVGEPADVLVGDRLGRGQPGRHVSAPGDFGDQLRALPHLFVAAQLERRAFAVAMTDETVAVEDGGDVAGERDRPVASRRLLAAVPRAGEGKGGEQRGERTRGDGATSPRAAFG